MVSRRELLASVSSGALLAGCTSLGDSSGTAETDPAFSYIAEVRSQSTSDAPLTIDVGLRNTGGTEVSIATTGRGDPFEELRPFTDGEAELRAVPTDSTKVTVDGAADAPVDGCWRLVGPDGGQATPVAVSTAWDVTVGPDERYTVTHHVYENATEGRCFRAGEYTSRLDVRTGGQTGDVAAELTYELSVDESKRASMSVSAAEPS